jgi:hypothetical protein
MPIVSQNAGKHVFFGLSGRNQWKILASRETIFKKQSQFSKGPNERKVFSLKRLWRFLCFKTAEKQSQNKSNVLFLSADRYQMGVSPYVHYAVTDRRRGVAEFTQGDTGQQLKFIRSSQNNNIAFLGYAIQSFVDTYGRSVATATNHTSDHIIGPYYNWKL